MTKISRFDFKILLFQSKFTQNSADNFYKALMHAKLLFANSKTLLQEKHFRLPKVIQTHFKIKSIESCGNGNLFLVGKQTLCVQPCKNV